MEKKEDKKQKKKEKRKPKYGLFSCVGYIYRLLWQTERNLVFVGIVTVPVSVIVAAFTLYTPSVVIRQLELQNYFSKVALVILGLLLGKLLFDFVNTVIGRKIETAEHHVLMQMSYKFQLYQLGRDWYHRYNPEVKKSDNRAMEAKQNNHTAGVHFPMDFAHILATILKFFLFGTVIATLHPIIILLLAAGCFVTYLVGAWERKKNWSERDKENVVQSKLWYMSWKVSRDFKMGKDVRLYCMQEPLHNRMQELHDESLRIRKKKEVRSLVNSMVSFLTVLVRDGAAYVFLIYKAASGEMDVASFLLYFSAVASMANTMGEILSMMGRVSQGAMQISDFREAMDTEDRLNRGEGIPVPTAPFSIEFKNVSYKYPEGEKKILDNVSFRIEEGEKIALVGLNGAGKTTLTMLMCGMLLPDEGEILLDGHTLYEYNRDEMYSLFGFVPQQFNLLPVSVARNIACAMDEEEMDRNRVRYCLETAGLWEKIASLPLGMDTPLNREVNKDGVEFSGGETQKLLLARLLYKDPLCMVLDEPTAALDPIAEDAMYRRYNEISARSTSVFISHRLASTRFCDRILFLDGAKFTEEGSHEELMAAGGKYKELFDIQSKYYKEGGNEDGE